MALPYADYESKADPISFANKEYSSSEENVVVLKNFKLYLLTSKTCSYEKDLPT